MNYRSPGIFTPPASRPSGWRAYATATLGVAVLAGVSAPWVGRLDPVNVIILFPLAVLVTAIRLGRGPAVLAALLSVGLFDFFFVAPQLTFAVGDLQHLLTFAVLLAVALITAALATSLRLQRDAAELRERHTRALYEMGGELSGALTVEQIAAIAARYVHNGFAARATLLLPRDDGELAPVGETGRAELARAAAAALGASPSPDARAAADPAVEFIALKAPVRMRGIMAVEADAATPPRSAEQRRLLETFAALVAIALERVHYIEVAQQAQVDMASERLRNSLLGALSHDLRTPLTALVGLADALPLSGPPLPAAQAEIADAIRDEALRTSSLVNNLLDMARLQSGKPGLRREWQPLEDVVGASLQARGRQLAAHRLRIDLPADLPLVEIDAVLMERVLCNLLENAAKYTPPGTQVDIGARDRGDAIEIVVADDGPGLPPGKERELFAKFSRGQTESATPGVGLGLAIVQAIVEAHGGRAWGENRRDGGARFVLELPRGEPPALPQPSA